MKRTSDNVILSEALNRWVQGEAKDLALVAQGELGEESASLAFNDKHQMLRSA